MQRCSLAATWRYVMDDSSSALLAICHKSAYTAAYIINIITGTQVASVACCPVKMGKQGRNVHPTCGQELHAKRCGTGHACLPQRGTPLHIALGGTSQGIRIPPWCRRRHPRTQTCAHCLRSCPLSREHFHLRVPHAVCPHACRNVTCQVRELS